MDPVCHFELVQWGPPAQPNVNQPPKVVLLVLIGGKSAPFRRERVKMLLLTLDETPVFLMTFIQLWILLQRLVQSFIVDFRIQQVIFLFQ